MKTNKCSHFYAVMPVWGRTYVQQFLEITLPRQIVDESIPAFSKKYPLTYVIVTSSSDMEAFNSSPHIQRLKEFAKVEILEFRPDEFPDLPNVHKMALCYQVGIDKFLSKDFDAGFIFLTPDSIWSAGFLKPIEHALEEGKRAVAVVGLRSSRSKFLELLEGEESRFGPSQALYSRSLVSIFNKSFHALHTSFTWESTSSNSMPAFIFWPLRNSAGWFSRSFVYHPLFVFPRQKFVVGDYKGDLSSVDHALVSLAGIKHEEIFVVTDSDQATLIDLTPDGHDSWQITKKVLSESIVVKWLLWGWSGPLQHFYAQFSVVFHAKDIDRHEIEILGNKTDLIINKIRTRYNRRKVRFYNRPGFRARAYEIKVTIAEITPMPMRKMYQRCKRSVFAFRD